jgi:hypothetical protein
MRIFIPGLKGNTITERLREVVTEHAGEEIVWNASTKLSKLNQLCGSVITFVVLYSSSVLNAVMTQEIMGITATKEKNTSDTYLKMIQIMAPAEYCFLRFFIYIAPFAAFFAALCSL